MKAIKILFTTLLVFTISSGLFAQDEAKNAIGLRLADSNGFGAEISYQLYTAQQVREAQVGDPATHTKQATTAPVGCRIAGD